MGTTVQGASFESPPGGRQTVYPGSVVSDWITLIDDVADAITAQSAAVLARPCTYSDSGSHPIKVPAGAVGFKVRLRFAHDISAVVASPVVRFYGMGGAAPSDAGVFADDGTVTFERVDNSSQAAAGLTLTPVVSGNTRLRDTTYGYSDILPASGRYDLRGAKWLLGLTETKGDLTSGGGGVVCAVQVQFIN